MRSTELKVGNLFYDTDGLVVEVADIIGLDLPRIAFWSKIKSIGFERYLNHESFPKVIPIDNYWLEKAGAIYPYKDFRCQIGNLCFYYNISGALFLNDSGYNEAISDVPIKYIHQLQNIYSSITGEDLDI